jgi:hypothetical protein
MKQEGSEDREQLKELFYGWSDARHNRQNFPKRFFKTFVLGLAIATGYLGKSAYQEFLATQEYHCNTHLRQLEKTFTEQGPEDASRLDAENNTIYQETINKYYSEISKARKNRNIGIAIASTSALLPFIGVGLLALYEKQRKIKLENFLSDQGIQCSNLNSLGPNLDTIKLPNSKYIDAVS